MRIPEKHHAARIFATPVLYDYEFCSTRSDLQRVMESINQNGYELVSVTQDINCYTVFFRRPVRG